MFQLMLEKMLHKKWMCGCLLIGTILLLGIAMSNPMYYHASLNRTLLKDLSMAKTKKVSQAGEIRLSGTLSKTEGGNTYVSRMGNLELGDRKKAEKVIEKEYKVPVKERQIFLCLPGFELEKTNMVMPETKVTLAPANLNDLTEHVTYMAGEGYDTAKTTGTIPCVISEKTMTTNKLMLGQTVTLKNYKDENGIPLEFEIVGVYTPNEDSYWMEQNDSFATELFVSDEQMDYLMEKATKSIKAVATLRLHYLLDTDVFSDYNYDFLISKTQELSKLMKKRSIEMSTGFLPTLQEYKESRNEVSMIMILLQVPLMILLVVFIYMVSNQMLSMEENEVAMLKSRGATRNQILLLYLLQSGTISLLSIIPAVPVSLLICKAIGASNSFLQFANRESLTIHFSFDILLYLVLAILLCMAVMVLPVIATSRLTIVEYKQENKKKKKPFWKRFYLDILLFALVGYIYYNFTQQKESLSDKIAQGGSIDYTLLLGSSLFILAAGLFSLRIMPKVVALIYAIGKGVWKPHVYASFLQTIRSSGRQEIISLFLVMTVAMGIFNAVSASTINQNMEQELRFENGSDIMLTENFDDNLPQARYAKEKSGTDVPITYTEADYLRYEKLAKKVDGMSRVYRNDTVQADVSKEDGSYYMMDDKISVMAIESKSFGECCYFRNDLSKKHWYHYLNLLAEQYDGVLINEAMAEEQNLKVGDSITMSPEDEMGRYEYDTIPSCKIVGIVPYFPMMRNSVEVSNKKGGYDHKSQYYAICNFDYAMSGMKVKQYSILIKTKNGNADPVYDFIKKQKIKLLQFTDTLNEILIEKEKPMLQVTNGILTVSFLIVILLCAVGFLIYWSLSLRERELLFGIYRAMGLSRMELKKMLIQEHLFSTFFSLITGVFVGGIVSYLFVPVMEVTYLPGSQIIPMHIVMDMKELAALSGVLLVMLLICITVLMRFVSRLNVSQALKLGED